MLLITFSGLDGCGKTTHVARTAAHLKNRGHRVRIVASAHVSLGALWNGVRRLITAKSKDSPILAGGSQAKPKASRPPAKPRQRATDRLSDVLRAWLIYPIDSLILSAWIGILRQRGYTVVVCDRYVYDQIVNLRSPIYAMTRLLLWLAPRPHVAFFLDADPATARDRRPEHDVGYYTSRHRKYHRLPNVCPEFTKVSSTTLEEVQRHLERLIDVRSHIATMDVSAGTIIAHGTDRLETGAMPDG